MPGIALPKELSGYRPQDVGLLTHALVAIIAPNLRDLNQFTLPERVKDVAGALVNGDNVNRRRVLMIGGAGHASTYLRRLAPAPPWELLGCEFDLGAKRVDVAWQHTETGRVFFDEIKTSNRPVVALKKEWLAQARGYAAIGGSRYGTSFAGVRLLPLGTLHRAVLVDTDGALTAIAPSQTDPLRSLSSAQTLTAADVQGQTR